METSSGPWSSSPFAYFPLFQSGRHTAKPPMWLPLAPAVCLSSPEPSPTWQGRARSLGVPKPTHPLPSHPPAQTHACWPAPKPLMGGGVWEGALDLYWPGRQEEWGREWGEGRRSPQDQRADSQQPAPGCEGGNPNSHPVGCTRPPPMPGWGDGVGGLWGSQPRLKP